MALILTYEQFNGRLNLVIEDGSFFDDYLEHWEQDIFVKLFGNDLWAQLQVDPSSPDMEHLVVAARKIMAELFYYDYVIEIESFQSTEGSMKSSTENATRDRQSRNHKAVSAYNRAVALYNGAYDELKAEYPLIGQKASLKMQNVWAI